MVEILELPAEILLLVLRELQLRDVLHFCATNRAVRATFKPELLLPILELHNYRARLCAIDEISHLLLCHALCELYRRRAPPRKMTPLIRRGASFGYTNTTKLVYDSVLKYGPGKMLTFLLGHGGAIRLPEAETLLLEAVRLKGPRHETVAMLLDHGVQLTRLPHIHDYLVDRFLEDIVITPHIQFLIDQGADFRQSSGGIHKVLERYFLRHGLGASYDYLIEMGSDLTKVPCGMNKLLEDRMYMHGWSVATDHLCAEGAFYEHDSLHQRLYDEFKEHGYSFHVRNLLSFQSVSLKELPAGRIDELLEYELKRTGPGESVNLLLTNGAALRNVPLIEAHINELVWSSLSNDMRTIQWEYLREHFRGWPAGVCTVHASLERVYRESGLTKEVLLLLEEDWIPRSMELDYYAGYSLETLFHNS